MNNKANKSDYNLNISFFINKRDQNVKKSKAVKEWEWRHYIAERLVRQTDMRRYGIRAIYLFGSTDKCKAESNSDIDLLIHCEGDDRQKEELGLWLSGWSKALAEINFLRTGYRPKEFLDIHFITNKDIQKKTAFATLIDSVYEPICLLYPLPKI